MIFSIVYFLKYFRHLDSAGEPELTLGGYYCPQCRAKYTELPVECKVCGMFSTCPCSSVCTLIFREHPCVQFSQSVSSLWNRSNFSFRSSPGPFLPSPLPPWGLPGDPTGEAWGREVSSTLTLWKPLSHYCVYHSINLSFQVLWSLPRRVERQKCRFSPFQIFCMRTLMVSCLNDI